MMKIYFVENFRMDNEDNVLEPIREWTYYPNGCHVGKRCVIDGYIKGNAQTTEEVTLEKVIGSSRKGKKFGLY